MPEHFDDGVGCLAAEDDGRDGRGKVKKEVRAATLANSSVMLEGPEALESTNGVNYRLRSDRDVGLPQRQRDERRAS